MVKFLESTGLNNIWLDQSVMNSKWLANKVKLTFNDFYIQVWHNEISNSSKGITYRIFKENFRPEHYLTKIPTKFCVTLSKFRMSNHKLKIEVGRWANTPRNERLCDICETQSLGDEFHFLFECSKLNNLRQLYLPNYALSRPNTLKLKKLMSSRNTTVLINLAKFISEGLKLL